MPRLAANLSVMFTELAFLERFEAAAKAGFKGVEYLFPYDYPAPDLARRLAANSLENVLFNLPPGDWDKGERGIAAIPGRQAEFEGSLDQALHYARALGCRRLHAMAGIPPAGAGKEDCQAVFIGNIKKAAAHFAADGITVLIEPINGRDMPGYFLQKQDHALAILDAVGEANVALQMDLYHCQVAEGDLVTKIRRNIGLIDHFQIAGVPERGEPDSGEINYPYLFKLIDSLGYEGWIGCEYRPKTETIAGLAWARPFLKP